MESPTLLLGDLCRGVTTNLDRGVERLVDVVALLSDPAMLLLASLLTMVSFANVTTTPVSTMTLLLLPLPVSTFVNDRC
jgi:hypothetical protein